VVNACRKTAIPRLLAMLCVLSVFVPSFFMVGVGRQLFVPLSLAVGLAMISSYLLSSTLVPVLSTWAIGRQRRDGPGGLFDKLRSAYGRYLGLVLRFRWPLVAVYLAGTAVLLWVAYPRVGAEIFPAVETPQFQIRMRAPTGTRVERTEVMALKAMDTIKNAVGPENVDITTDYIGVQPASYPVNTIFLFTSGQHEAVLRVALKPDAPKRGAALREELRAKLHQAIPEAAFSFEAGDIITQVMSFGSPTPIEVDVEGANLASNREFAGKVRLELAKIPALRDLQFAQPLDYPSLKVTVDRGRAGQFGVTMADVAKSLVAATSSSRFTDPNYWRDPKSGNAFQIQLEVPQNEIASREDVGNLPVMSRDNGANESSRPLVDDVATIDYGTTMGEVDRYNMQRVVGLTANVHGEPLGTVAGEVRAAIARAGVPPRGVSTDVRGQVPPFEETFRGLRNGLLLSVVVIFLLLAANFESFRLTLAVVSAVPAVIGGVLVMLLATGTTLNVQSFMGAIMAIGISVANAILLVTFAEAVRHEGAPVFDAVIEGGRGRLRAILMTATAMIAGMIPMALASGQTAPLGRAVIGGLVAATMATLTVLPAVYAMLQRRAGTVSASLDPQDPASRYYEPA
jgi:multidrug efflux pump subunit AcrB